MLRECKDEFLNMFFTIGNFNQNTVIFLELFPYYTDINLKKCDFIGKTFCKFL